MGAIVCELCGSNDIAKRGEFFVCEHCGTKYTTEDAKKLVVQGVVKLDNTEKLANLYKIARRARDDGNSASAEKYYDMILVEDPMSWEATFYVVYFRAMQCKIAQIKSAANAINNCVPTVLELIHDNVSDEAEQVAAVTEIMLKVFYGANLLQTAAHNHYSEIDYQIREKYRWEAIERSGAAVDIVYTFATYTENLWGNNQNFCKFAATAWKTGIDYQLAFQSLLPASRKAEAMEILKKQVEKVKKYEPDYEAPATGTEGCYVATAVYGSYDCPQVWTLRRFRDFSLSRTWTGRVFIKMYYAMSPTIVRWFGDAEWFKRMWRSKLDAMVVKLNASGVENTPYNDRQWK